MPEITSAEDLIRLHEGEGPVVKSRFLVYDDATGHPITAGSTVVGHPTIGVGRNLEGRGMSRAEIDGLLHNDIAAAVHACERYDFFERLNEPRKAAMVDLMFNIGAPRFSTFRRMIHALYLGDYATASVELLDSKYAEQVKTRALRNSEILYSGKWPAA